MWNEVQLFIPEHAKTKLFGSGLTDARDARRLVARLNDSHGRSLPNGFFNYDDRGPKSGMSPIRFSTFREGIRLYGIGEAGVDLLDENSHKVRRMISEEAEQTLKEQRFSGDTRIARSNYPISYSIGTLVFQNRRQNDLAQRIFSKLTRTEADTRLPEVTETIAELIPRSLERQINDLHRNDPGITIDTDGFSFEFQDSPWEIVSISHLSNVRVSQPDKKPAFAFAAHNVVVRSCTILDGVWHVGRLCGRGFGKLNRLYGGQAH